MLWSLPAHMARHSFVWVRVHLVWSTYRRQPLIAREWRERLHRYVAAVAHRKGALPLSVGGVQDHIHVYVSLGPDTSVARLVNALKANSSRWVRTTFPGERLFAWQKGYAAFSVDRRGDQRVISYIRNQEAHHRARPFDRELHQMLVRHDFGVGGLGEVKCMPRPSLPRPVIAPSLPRP